MANKFIEVPLGGNSFITNKPQLERDRITPKGFENWTNENYTYCVYFKPAVDAELTIYLAMNAARCGATIAAFSILSFCLFILFMGFSRQEY